MSAALLTLVVTLGWPLLGVAAPSKVDGEWKVITRPAGASGRTELAFVVHVERGWHVNAHEPGRPYLIPTTLDVEPPAQASVEEIRYPKAVSRTLRFAGDKPLELYEGDFEIGVVLTGAATGTLTGKLKHQACSDDQCLPPAVVTESLNLAAQAGGAGGAGAVDARPPTDSAFERLIREHGLLATLAIAVLFGFGLNLTPCVYPLISITIAYFGGQGRDTPSRVAVLASAYVLGIALTFSTLGVVAALSGGLFGAALQRPAVLIGIAAVLLALAAGNFGLYQFRLPSALTHHAGKSARGVVGALAMGLTMGVVAAPCVGPTVVALLLFVAARQDAVLGFALFFALALGMGLPYLALAFAADSIKRLPRSGEWLVWIEHLFGFLLIALAVYFLRPVIGERVGDFATAAVIAFGGIYLGFVDRAGRALAGFQPFRRAAAIVAVAAAVWVATPRASESKITWETFTPEALSQAAASGTPAIVDFTATWCIPCRENDAYTFTHDAVAAEARRFVMLRADVSEMSKETEDWMSRFEVVGVPTILFYGSDGRERTRVVGFVDAERFLALTRGLS